ncbi:regulatory protein RecX [Gracilinema caldarium]|nr:regulatory protein RecX [Gracilinema caldarium]
MTVTSVKPGADADLLKIGLSDGSLFFIRLSYLPQTIKGRVSLYISHSSCSNLDLTDEDYRSLSFASECVRVERKALQLINRAEQTRLGLMQKLLHKQYSEQTVKIVLDRLEALLFVDDKRFAKAWIQSRLRHSGSKSASQLVYGLLKRGVDSRIATVLVRELYPPELEKKAIQQFIEKKHLLLDHLTPFELKQILLKAQFSKRAILLYLEDR